MTARLRTLAVGGRFGGGVISARLLGQATEFVGFAVIARRLGPSQFGALSAAFLLARYLGLFADWGASIRGVRDTARLGVVDVRALVRLRTVASTVLAVLFVAGCLAAGRLHLAPIAGCLVARGMNRDWLALGAGRAVRAAWSPVAQGVLLLAGSTIIRSPAGASAAVGTAYLSGLAASLALNRVPPPRGAPVPTNVWLMVAGLFDQVTATIDVMVLATLRDASEAGLYAAAYRIPAALISVAGLAVLAALPAVARRVRDLERLSELWRRSVRLALVALPTCVVGGGLAALAFPVAFGDRYRSATPVVYLLVTAAAIKVSTSSFHPLFVSFGRDRLQAAIFASAAALNLAGNLALVPRYGATGAALATVASELALMAALITGTRRAVFRAVGRGSSGTPRVGPG